MVLVEHSDIVVTLKEAGDVGLIYSTMAQVEAALAAQRTTDVGEGDENDRGGVLAFTRVDEEYGEKSVAMRWTVPESAVEMITARLTEATRGTASVMAVDK